MESLFIEDDSGANPSYQRMMGKQETAEELIRRKNLEMDRFGIEFWEAG